MALPDADKYDVKMYSEIHSPARLNTKMVDEYVQFIEQSKHFGIHIDFKVFQSRPRRRHVMLVRLLGEA